MKDPQRLCNLTLVIHSEKKNVYKFGMEIFGVPFNGQKIINSLGKAIDNRNKITNTKNCEISYNHCYRIN